MKRLTYFLILSILPAISFAADFVAGKDYLIIDNPAISASSENTATVTEFFSYGCPWCYKLETALSTWRKTLPQTTTFQRVPVVFEPGWDIYAKAYYAADSLGLNKTLSPALFQAIQVEKKHLNKAPAMIQFFVDHGVEKATAESAFTSSSALDIKVRNGMRQMQLLGIRAVPAIVINNRYKVDLVTAKGDEKRLFAICDFLLKK